MSVPYVKYITWAYFTVGQPLPFANPTPGLDNTLLFINDSNLNLVLFSTNTAADLTFWESAEVTVSLFNAEKLPFMVMAFPDQQIFCDFFMNGKEFTDEGFNAFTGNAITDAKLMLVDAETNTLVAVREVPLPAVLVVKIKALLRSMRNQPEDDTPELNRKALVTQAHVTSLEMWKLSMQYGPAEVGYSPKQS